MMASRLYDNFLVVSNFSVVQWLEKQIKFALYSIKNGKKCHYNRKNTIQAIQA